MQEKLNAERASSEDLRQEVVNLRGALEEQIQQASQSSTNGSPSQSFTKDIPNLMQTLTGLNEQKLDVISELLDRFDDVVRDRDEKQAALQEAQAQVNALAASSLQPTLKLDADEEVASNPELQRTRSADLTSAVSWPCNPHLGGGSTACSIGSVSPSGPLRTLIVEISDLCLQSQQSLSYTVDHALSEILSTDSDCAVMEVDLKGLREVAGSLHASVERISRSAHRILARLQNGGVAPSRDEDDFGTEGVSWAEASTPQREPPCQDEVASLAISAQAEQGPVELVKAEVAAERSLSVCQRLCTAASSAVQSLSTAGSGLQHVLSNNPGDRESGLASLADHDDPLVQRVSGCLLTALGSVSIALIDLAAALSVEVLQPLESLHRDVSSKRNDKRSELDLLRQRRQVCTDAINASLQRSKDLATQAEMEKDASFIGWFARTSYAPEPELKRKQNDEQRVVEDHREQLMALMNTEQVVSQSLGEELSQVEVSLRRVLGFSLAHFPGAWAKIVSSMRLEVHALGSSG